jgi:hypothetical protein
LTPSVNKKAAERKKFLGGGQYELMPYSDRSFKTKDKEKKNSTKNSSENK